jgi:hypothetical protein
MTVFIGLHRPSSRLFSLLAESIRYVLNATTGKCQPDRRVMRP